jgi:mono/diheme cytochrome c family protein
MRVTRAILATLLVALLTHRAQAQVPRSPELVYGEHIAQLICAACHVVARDQEFPPLLSRSTPSFIEIASRPDVSAASLEHFITRTHWDPVRLPMAMPNPALTPEQTRAVARYILSLKAPLHSSLSRPKTRQVVGDPDKIGTL